MEPFVAKFPIGRVVATPGVLELEKTLPQSVVLGCLLRHVQGDWGDLDEHDTRLNEEAMKPGIDARIFSSYILPSGDKVWVITEADRSVTTVLLPDEY